MSNLATNYNNYFGLTVGPAFGGTVGSYSAPTGYTFGVYWVRLFWAARVSNVIKQLRVTGTRAKCSHRRYGVADKLSADGGTLRRAVRTQRKAHRGEALDNLAI